MTNPKTIIIIGALCFFVAFVDSLTVSYYSYDCWFACMHLIGKVATVGVAAALGWLFIVTLIKR